MKATRVIRYRQLLLVFLGTVSALSLSAQEVLVQGSAEKLIVDSRLMKQYEHETMEWAINNALYKKYGSSVTTNFESLTETALEGKSVISHNQLRSNYVHTYPNGVWTKHKNKPVYTSYKDQKDNWWLKCEVSGWAKEMPTQKVEFVAKALDGIDYIKDETVHFISGERAYIHFRSNTSGYLNIFYNDFNNVQRCLPYNASKENMLRIKPNKDYLFFDAQLSELGNNKYLVDEVELYTDKDLEYNQFIFLYSEEEIFPPLLEDEKDLGSEYRTFKYMKRDDFYNWLQGCRLMNNNLQVEVIGITIKGTK